MAREGSSRGMSFGGFREVLEFRRLGFTVLGGFCRFVFRHPHCPRAHATPQGQMEGTVTVT